ncbi:MAG: hypothetical protein IT204_06250 [Fimbriimonadaceae bacterium]|nr:hypothetical protein [Fimbriimonadaceae bacterium]
MSSLIVVHPRFDGEWPFAADHLQQLWAASGPTRLQRLAHEESRPLGSVAADSQVTRLVSCGVPVTAACVNAFPRLREAALLPAPAPAVRTAWETAGVTLYQHRSEGFWGQSVAEFALALTLAALRRIPQTGAALRQSQAVWDYRQPAGAEAPGRRGLQFGDDPRFCHGTIAGKRVRVVGLGNIGSRYAAVCAHLGADVAGWDPIAPEAAFHRSGTRQVERLDELVADADIFAPMLPLREATAGVVTAAHLQALPRGTLVVLVTRAGIVDMPSLRQRVLAAELALAADVFDLEPLPLDDPLLRCEHAVLTPHNAGRTAHANQQFVAALAAQFRQSR